MPNKLQTKLKTISGATANYYKVKQKYICILNQLVKLQDQVLSQCLNLSAYFHKEVSKSFQQARKRQFKLVEGSTTSKTYSR